MRWKKCTRRRTKCRWTGRVARKGCLFKKQQVCVRPKISSKGLKCTLSTNPHFITFDGKKFNQNQGGRFAVYKRKTFRIFAQRKKWGNTRITSSISVIAGKKRRNSVKTINPSKYIINGKLVRIGVKRQVATYTLLIKRISKTRTLIRSRGGNWILIRFHSRRSLKGKRVWHQSQYLTASVGVKKTDGASGLCVGGDVKKITPKKRAVKAATKCQTQLARKVCKGRKVPKSKFGKCVALFLTTNPPCAQ